MFENRSEKQQIIIYAVIALIITLVLSIYHFYTFKGIFANPYVIILFANIEFFIFFYIIYMPLKVKRSRQKEEEKEK